MQQVQSTSIRNGNQLEQCIEECADRYGCLYSDIDKFLLQAYNFLFDDLLPSYDLNVYYLFTKADVVNSTVIHSKHETDYLLLGLFEDDQDGYFYLSGYFVEMKDGWVFDTKKSEMEANILEEEADNLFDILLVKGFRREELRINYYFCGFSAMSKDQVVRGTKHRFVLSQVLTGYDFCNELLGYPELFDDIEDTRYIGDQGANVTYFLTTILEDLELRQMVKDLLHEFEE